MVEWADTRDLKSLAYSVPVRIRLGAPSIIIKGIPCSLNLILFRLLATL